MGEEARGKVLGCVFTRRLKNNAAESAICPETRISRALGRMDLGPWKPVPLTSVRLLSGSGRNTGPAGLCGWAEGEIGRMVRRKEEGDVKKERHWSAGRRARPELWAWSQEEPSLT